MAATDGGGGACMAGGGGGGAAPGPDGGARLTAAPGSGTAAGGTGGGRSLKNCAATGVTADGPSRVANTSIGRSHRLRRNRLMPPPVVVIVLLFTENAANSSLGIHGEARKRRFSAALLAPGAAPAIACTDCRTVRARGCGNFKSAASGGAITGRINHGSVTVPHGEQIRGTTMSRSPGRRLRPGRVRPGDV